MRLGEIYLWETDQAQGHEKRRKYHIFIGRSDEIGNVFLFIHTMDWYKDYRILKKDYDFLSYDSFVGCNAIAKYTDAEIKSAAPAFIVQMTQPHLKELRDAIIAAETMPLGHANLVCRALAAAQRALILNANNSGSSKEYWEWR
jgi:hypothetical protein